nr:HIT family protein [Pseudoruegeria sp. HB172150]
MFCRIAAGDVEASILHADDMIVAFLDIEPIRRGHVQIVPRRHYDYFEDLPTQTASAILALGQRLSRAMKRLYGVRRVGFAFTGGDIAHAHAHVIPLHEHTDLTSRRYIAEDKLTFVSLPRQSAVERQDVVDELRRALEGEG